MPWLSFVVADERVGVSPSKYLLNFHISASYVYVHKGYFSLNTSTDFEIERQDIMGNFFVKFPLFITRIKSNYREYFVLSQIR